VGVLCLTFDNLGEAADLGAGSWSPDAPLGRHFSVGVVRRLLDLLDRHRLHATFFVEAFNAELYPAVLREIADRGHEVACHAWQHESWGALAPARERELLTRCTDALRGIGLEPVGFRPPGGQVTARTPRRLAELGYRYYSPAGSRAGMADGLAVLPFAWELIDAFFYAPPLAGLRERHGLPREPQAPATLRSRVVEAVQEGARHAAVTTLLFHPFLLDDPARLRAFEDVLIRARALADAGALECLTMRAAAERLLAHPGEQPAPEVDAATWAAAAGRPR
jgi:peptidoglycan/xylan/chitin deacetylase (PgdA/CDA1 family)